MACILGAIAVLDVELDAGVVSAPDWDEEGYNRQLQAITANSDQPNQATGEATDPDLDEETGMSTPRSAHPGCAGDVRPTQRVSWPPCPSFSGVAIRIRLRAHERGLVSSAEPRRATHGGRRTTLPPAERVRIDLSDAAFGVDHRHLGGLHEGGRPARWGMPSAILVYGSGETVDCGRHPGSCWALDLDDATAMWVSALARGTLGQGIV